jgi:nucleoid-associated protein YgaU
MKRILSWMVVLVFALVLAGCQSMGKKKETPSDQTDMEKSAMQEVQPETETDANQPADTTDTTAAPLGGGRTHVVQKGDTLFSLARQYYGPENQRMWRKIWEANRDKVPQPDQIKVGQELIIP